MRYKGMNGHHRWLTSNFSLLYICWKKINERHLKKKFFILFKSNRPFIFVENALDILISGWKGLRCTNFTCSYLVKFHANLSSFFFLYFFSSSQDPFMEWTFGKRFREDCLVLDSFVALPLAAKLSIAAVPGNDWEIRKMFLQGYIACCFSYVTIKRSGNISGPKTVYTASSLEKANIVFIKAP